MTFDVEFVLNDRTFNVNTEQGAVVPPAPGAQSIITKDGTVVSQNADFAEVAEWADGNPDNEDRTGYFVCANVPVNGIIMKKATSIDDVKGVSILAPAFAGNYTKDKLDNNGNLLPKYSYVAIIGFVPVRDNGTCTVGGRCMPDDNGCAVPSSNSMGYQVVNRIDENRVLIIIEPNGDMVQRIKTKVNQMQEEIDNLSPDQTYNPGSPNAQSGIAVAEAISTVAQKEWELIEDISLTEAVVGINLPVELMNTKKELHIEGYIVPTDTTITSQPFSFNDGSPRWQASVNCKATGVVYLIMDIYNSARHRTIFDGTISSYGYSLSGASFKTTVFDAQLSSGSAKKLIDTNSLTLRTNTNNPMAVGTKIKIWGR